MENGMKVNIQHLQAQQDLNCMEMSSSLADALCHRTSIRKLTLDNQTIFSNDWFLEENQKTVDSKIQKVCLEDCSFRDHDPTTARDLARFLCLQPCLIDLTISNLTAYHWLHDDFYHEIARSASSSKIQKLYLKDCNLKNNDPTASRDLASFLCLQPCLTSLTISIYGGLRDDFYHEIARLGRSSKIEKLSIECVLRGNDPTASHDLARFICLQPCLTNLTIKCFEAEKGDDFGSPGWLHDEFYHEIASLASSSKIERLLIDCSMEIKEPTASRDLAKFICLLPCLTDLEMTNRHQLRPHDDFYHELALLAFSSKIGKLQIDEGNFYKNDPSASRDLAKFLCLLPCLTDLMMLDLGLLWLRDDFYHELALLASSSKIGKLTIFCYLKENDQSASRDLAKFLCLLPCLTDLEMSGPDGLCDAFYHELALLASSSKNHFFNKKLHLDERSGEWKEMNLEKKIEYIRRVVHPTLSKITTRPTNRPPEPLSLHQGSVQQQIEYPSVVTPLDLEVPSTSGINAQRGKVPEALPPSVSQNLPSTVNIHLEAANSSRMTGNTIIGQQININCPRHSSKDDSLGGHPRKRKKKTNRKTDSTNEDKRTRGDEQTKIRGSKVDSLGGHPRKRKKKTNRKADSSDED